MLLVGTGGGSVQSHGPNLNLNGKERRMNSLHMRFLHAQDNVAFMCLHGLHNEAFMFSVSHLPK